ncbi:acyltransferase family protein [Synoicihabitans lomoniglobus]|uniref:Acyltransferase n=1 Tax=Synoicihabitans lomoniglobus TaxID=2909285 RepID=A0AAF0CQU5_9BACT|nr:acyltransferase [Opitutaceae bacterium LMO-M01]WED66362.1 acyltransferase [Opitutaceae bacterium LMO-M01]
MKKGLSPPKEYFPLLDLLRGPAALLVFLEHWRNLFFVDFVDLEQPGMLLKLFYLATGAGHQAVMVFFVLSGCVIAHVVFTSHQRSSWSEYRYLLARVTRLWVVLIPALLLTAFWDWAGMRNAGGGASIYDGTGFGHILSTPLAEVTSPGIFLGNLLFLQKVFVPTFGSNGPLWSISYEFIYYLVYPALITVRLASQTAIKRTGAALFALGLLAVAGGQIAAHFPVWLAGAGAYYLFRRRKIASPVALWSFGLGLVALAGVIATSRTGFDIPGIDWSWIICLITAVGVFFGLQAQLSPKTIRLVRPMYHLSAISYSLYLLHTPLFVFIASLFFRSNRDRWIPDLWHLAIATLIAVIVFGYCVLIWSFTERKTDRLRRWLVNVGVIKPVVVQTGTNSADG